MKIKDKFFGKGRSISPKKRPLNHDQVLKAIQGKKDFAQKGSLNFRLLAFAGEVFIFEFYQEMICFPCPVLSCCSFADFISLFKKHLISYS